MKSLYEMLGGPGSRPTVGAPAADEDATGTEDAGTGLFRTDPSFRVVMVTAFGIDAAQLDTALKRALSGLPSHNKVICVVDQPDFLPLRRRGVSFEYLPPPSARSGFSDAARWRTYLDIRYEILLSKWRPTHVISAGKSLEQFLSEMS